MSGNTVAICVVRSSIIILSGIIYLVLSRIIFLSGIWNNHGSCSDGTNHCCGIQHCWRPSWVKSDNFVPPRSRWISWIYRRNRGMAFWYQLSGILPEKPIHRFRSLRSSKHVFVCQYSWWELKRLRHRYFGWEGSWRDLCSDQRRLWIVGFLCDIYPRGYWRAVRNCAAILVLLWWTSNPIRNLIHTRASVKLDVLQESERNKKGQRYVFQGRFYAYRFHRHVVHTWLLTIEAAGWMIFLGCFCLKRSEFSFKIETFLGSETLVIVLL